MSAEAATTVEVRRRGALLGAVGVAAAVVAAAYLSRASSTGAALDWTLTVVLASIAGLYLAGLVDARTPLFVADADGAGRRRGRNWTRWSWAEVLDVELRPAGRLADGRIALLLTDGDRVAVPLGLGARLVADGDAATALSRLAGSEAEAEHLVVSGGGSPEPLATDVRADLAAPHWRDPRPVLAHGISALADRLPTRSVRLLPSLGRTGLEVEGALAVAPAADGEPTQPVPLPELDELRRPDLALEDLVGRPDGDHAADLDPDLDPDLDADLDADLTEAIVLPVADPVIGPQLCQARARLALAIPELSARTRIREHVLEAIERDDFAACGGDFYARGHLRTLARVLGLEAAPLLSAYDDTYAARPALGGAPRAARPAALPVREPASPRESPRWSVLVAAVMAVVLAWSVARLVIDGPVPERVPGLSAGSGGVRGTGAAADAVPVLLRAAGGGAHVVVRDGNGRIAFTGDLAFGSSRSLDVVPPVRVDSSDGGLELVVNGADQGRIGELGHPASDVFDGG